jgi:O-antigen ligase
MYRVGTIVAVAALFLPFEYPVIRPGIDAVTSRVSGVAPSLDRGTGELSELEGRAFVWRVSISRLGAFPKSNLLLGWGPNGHVESGLSSGYAYRFQGAYEAPRLISPHNSLLQELVDGGLVGAAGLLGAVVVSTRRLTRMRNDPAALAALGLVVSISISGATENLLAPGSNTLPFAVLLAGAAAAAKPLRRAGQPPKPKAGSVHLPII